MNVCKLLTEFFSGLAQLTPLSCLQMACLQVAVGLEDVRKHIAKIVLFSQAPNAHPAFWVFLLGFYVFWRGVITQEL